MHTFYLVADYSELPWTRVVWHWAHRPSWSPISSRSLCLTDQPRPACGYLLVGRDKAKLLAALRGQFSLLNDEAEVIWLNDANGEALIAPSPEQFLLTHDPAAYAAPCPTCGLYHPICPQCARRRVICSVTEPGVPFAWCEDCEAEYRAAPLPPEAEIEPEPDYPEFDLLCEMMPD